ncbi:MAG: efflux transporter periplasmic adaptor subunit [Flavobacterium sp. BFFFF2]|nr:MAG: efflux transporter periplasmic adaptor subunit [Flavobacterium sp. BFFFF2]
MQKIILGLSLLAVMAACQKKEGPKSISKLIETKDIKGLQAKKDSLQADVATIEGALAKLDIRQDEQLVDLQTVKDTIFTHYLEIQGSVNTKENILVQPEFSGTLRSLLVKAGQHVSKGQLLGTIDDAGLSQQLAGLENQYSLAQTTFERQKNLWNQKIGSEIQFLQAKTQMVAAQKGVAQLKAQLEKTQIRAPFSGTIDEVFVERGQVVAPSMQGLMRIVNLGNMYVSTSVPENYVSKVKVGTTVQVYLSSLQKTYPGKVRQVGNFINPTNRSFGIEVSVPNPSNLLRPNQVAKLQIVDYRNPKTIVVPAGVILEDAKGEKYVYVAENVTGKTATAKKRSVKVGMTAGNGTEIMSGLQAGDQIVTDGFDTLSEGMKLIF